MEHLPYQRLELEDVAVYKREPDYSQQPRNPARRYLFLGLALACCGLVLSVLAVGGLLWLTSRAFSE